MKTIDFSGFQDDEYEVITADQVEVLPAESKNAHTGGVPSAGAASVGAVEIIGCVRALLDIVPTVSRCIADVKMEQERTKQVKAAAKAAIEQAREETARVKVIEENKTRLAMIEAEKELQLAEKHLQEFLQSLENNEKVREKEHADFISQLNELDEVVKTTQEIISVLIEKLKMATDREEREQIYCSLEKAHSELVNLAPQIVALRRDYK